LDEHGNPRRSKIVNVKYLSWELDGSLMIGDWRGRRKAYWRQEMAPTARPHIIFEANVAYCQSLLDADTLPEDLFIREKSGDVFKFGDARC
jgi:hypothetical protein